MSPETFLTTKQAAALLTFSPKTLERMRCKGNGPKCLKLGGKIVYRQSDINNWIEANLYTSTSDFSVRKPPKEKPVNSTLEELRARRRAKRKLRESSNDPD